jgi:hypothetical protein
MAELGVAVLELLPPHGVLHVPVDPRLSNNVVDTIHHVRYIYLSLICLANSTLVIRPYTLLKHSAKWAPI